MVERFHRPLQDSWGKSNGTEGQFPAVGHGRIGEPGKRAERDGRAPIVRAEQGRTNGSTGGVELEEVFVVVAGGLATNDGTAEPLAKPGGLDDTHDFHVRRRRRGNKIVGEVEAEDGGADVVGAVERPRTARYVGPAR